MRRIPLTALALWLVAVPGLADKAPAKPAAPPPTPTADSCTHVRGSVRQEAFGYTHVVSLHNGCEKPVSCQLWSSVDPEPRATVTVAPGEMTEVITRRGSPAREVTGFRKCSFL
jgi:hypothetical protein